MNVAMPSLSLYDLNLWTKAKKKSPSLSLSLSSLLSSPKLKTRHYKTTIFSQNSKTKRKKTQKGGFMIFIVFSFDFFPSSNSVFAQIWTHHRS
jgi:hypothetical protein